MLASVALGLGAAQHAHLRRAHGGAFRCEEVVGARSWPLNAGRLARAPRNSCTISRVGGRDVQGKDDSADGADGGEL